MFGYCVACGEKDMNDNFVDKNGILHVPQFTISAPPKPVGYWVIGTNFYIEIRKKPTDEQIKNHYEMLGWE